ncbi:Meiotic sister-chromatid recombination- protein 3 [Maudiozyma exigua]|uniref:Meiotic sister-chromatid recombination- protein 3 n=1 Tax=Maudiozyma exigua TaxID=34358 RepID=A0A9P6W146_MAUEX|nr:Meiotic sister-chromatid recombination- protein 3 [Kazachstania exigua]
MVFGLSRKEHRVPDLSRYDYYYQNNQDFNRSARLSAAAASAASNNGRRTVSSQHQEQQRASSLMTHEREPHRRASSAMPRQMHSSISNTNHALNHSQSVYINNNNSSSRPRVKVKKSNYKTYSLRSETSDDQNRLPIKQSNNNNKMRRSNTKSTITAKQKVSTTIPQTNKHTNIQQSEEQLDMKNKKKKTIKKKMKKPIANNSRLNSITSNNSNNIQLRKISTNDSRSNSITTQITKVKDPQGRTTSITRKTIKRIDGYEYVETTTTTTTVAPVNETESLDSDQRHFNEFNDEYIIDSDFASIQDIQEETENEESPLVDGQLYDQQQEQEQPQQEDRLSLHERSLDPKIETTQEEMHDHEIDDPSEQIVDSTRLSDIPPIPQVDVEKLNESRSELIENDNYESQDPIVATPSTIDEQVPGTYDYDYNNPYADEDEQEQDIPQERDTPQETSLQTQKKIVHPYAQQTKIKQPQKIYQDEPKNMQQSYSSNSIFSDALEEIPGVTIDDTTINENSKPITTKTKTVKRSKTKSSTKKPVVKKATQYKHINRDTHPNESQRSIVSQQSIRQKEPPKPKKPLTEAEMYQKALEIATKKVYSDRLPQTTNKKPEKSMMGSRMTLRNEPMNTNTPTLRSLQQQQEQHTTASPKKYKRLSLFSFEKHHKEPEQNYDNVPLPVNSSVTIARETNALPATTNTPVVTKVPSPTHVTEPVPVKEPMETKSTMSDADMYAKALEVAQKKYRDAHYIDTTGIPVTTTNNISATSGLSSGIRSSSNNNSGVPLENVRRSSVNDQLSKTTTGSIHHPQEIKSNVSFLRTDPISNNDSSGGMRLSLDSKRKVTNMSNETRNIDETIPATNNSISIPENDMPAVASSAIARPAIVTTAPEPDRYITTDVNHNITTISNTNTSLPHDTINHHPIEKLTTNESTKHRSKFKHFVDKVVQFSTENSGYQLSKDEQVRLQNQKMNDAERLREGRNFLNVDQTRNQITGHSQGVTVTSNQMVTPVVPVNPVTINKIDSVSSFQRKNVNNNENNENGNNTSITLNTISSSIFSKDKAHATESPPQTSTNYIPTALPNQESNKIADTIPPTSGQENMPIFQDTNHGNSQMDRIITPVTVVANNSGTVETHTKSTPAPSKPQKKKGFFKKLFKR